MINNCIKNTIIVKWSWLNVLTPSIVTNATITNKKINTINIMYHHDLRYTYLRYILNRVYH